MSPHIYIFVVKMFAINSDAMDDLYSGCRGCVSGVEKGEKRDKGLERNRNALRIVYI